MAAVSDDLLNLIYETKAVSIWNRQKGPVFWYTAGVPGPFFVNTEWIIGRDLASTLVDGMTAILETTSNPADRARCITETVMAAYESDIAYRRVIAAMVAKAKDSFSPGAYDFISGGERRDWLFSIPLAREIGCEHVFLFKDQSMYCEQAVTAGESALQVADLINNAASYFDRWLPALAKAQLRCAGTICVNSRGNGAEKLEQTGIKVVTLARIDVVFFERFLAHGLIDHETLDEIACHARAPGEWAEKYLFSNPTVLDVARIDKKSFERLQSFITQDPWNLRPKHKDLFDAIHAQIAARLKSAA